MPNQEDIEWERKWICAPTMITKNQKLTMLQNRYQDPKSIGLLRQGKIPTNPADKQFVPNTWKLYRTRAQDVMTILKEKLNQDIHYSDFHAFGEPGRLIQPCGIIKDLELKLPSGNHNANAYEAYQLILQSQLVEAEQHEAKFASEVVNSGDLTKAQPSAACRDRVRLFSFDINAKLTKMKHVNPHKQFTSQKADSTETRCQSREKQQGQTVPNAAEVLLKYLNNDEVKQFEKPLLNCASEPACIPTPEEFHQLTND